MYSKKYNLQFDLSSELINASVEVNVVGLTEINKAQWEQVKVDEYFGGDRQKRSIKKVFQFTRGSSQELLILDDVFWSEWSRKGVQYIYVVASIPGLISDVNSSMDPRVLILPIDYARWRQRDLSISINSSGLQMNTFMYPE